LIREFEHLSSNEFEGKLVGRPTKPVLMAEAVYNKIGACPIGLAHEAELLEHCKLCTCELSDPPSHRDPIAFATKFDDFATTKRLLGSPVALPQGCLLGRLNELNRTAQILAAGVGGTKDFVAQNLRWLAGQGSTTQFDDAKYWFDTELAIVDSVSGRGRQASGLPCWLFLGEDGRNPEQLLSDPDCIDLPCRLGLPMRAFLDGRPRLPQLEFVGFAVKQDRIRSPRSAAVFDGDYESVKEVWSPTGFTEPLAWGPDECTAKGGLREIVAEPLSYDEIQSQIFVFHSRAH
jgi:hypothetical protein